MSSPGESPPPGPPPWRVRFGGQAYRVKDERSLRRLVETGKVPQDAEVEVPGRPGWVPLRVAMGLSPPAAARPDPWSIWEGLSDEAEAPTAPPPVPRPSPERARSEEAEELMAWRPQRERFQAPGPSPAEPQAQHEVHEAHPAEDDEEVASVDSEAPVSLGPGPGPLPLLPPVARPRALESAPLPAAPVSPGEPAPPRRADNVIYFPGPRSARAETQGAHALAPETLPFPLVAPPRPVKAGGAPHRSLPADGPGGRSKDPGPARTNWWRVGGIAFFGLLLVGGWAFYVSMTSTAEFRPLPTPLPTAPPGAQEAIAQSRQAAASPAGAEPVPAASLEDPYHALEQEIRGQLSEGTMPVTSADELETALLIELNRTRLDVVRVQVTVLELAEGTEAPRIVELRLRLRTQGQLDREIGAAALVLGKYAQLEGLEVPLLELSFEEVEAEAVLKRRIEIDQCQALYLRHLRLGDFLDRLAR